MCELQISVRAQISILKEEGYTERSIAECLSVSKTAVHNTITRLQQTGSLTSRKRSGRQKCTSMQTDRLIHRTCTNSPMSSSTVIQHNLPSFVTVSSRTIRRRLSSDCNLHARRPSIKPRLSAKNIKDRIAFCQKHKDWTALD
ncbi:uncharacterized protein LOC124814571 [Hydra vulgaris]|uniref:uncharacterized protein LOC124814571 n=1 Tax=Hydra vulgaris TaxID=6087 RepID=UPI001F5E40A9|nr:uncharacterized protein LOC124814571 [Hydra vulgaris]